MYGRQTTLEYLRARRDDYSRHPFRRKQADRAIKQIISQLRDKKLLRLRERLIRATRAGDDHWIWKIENQIRAHEKNFAAIEKNHYSKRDEDE